MNEKIHSSEDWQSGQSSWENAGKNRENLSSQEEAMLKYGEENMRRIGELPDHYHVPAEHKLLFASLSEKDDDSGYPILKSKHPHFTALGFEYNDKRFGFNDIFKHIIHKEVVLKECSVANSMVEAKRIFEEKNRTLLLQLEDIFEEDAKVENGREIDEILQKNKKRLDELKKEKKDRNSIKDEDIHRYIIENAIMTREQIDVYVTRAQKKNDLLRLFRQELLESLPREQGSDGMRDFVDSMSKEMNNYLRAIVADEARNKKEKEEKDALYSAFNLSGSERSYKAKTQRALLEDHLATKASQENIEKFNEKIEQFASYWKDVCNLALLYKNAQKDYTFPGWREAKQLEAENRKLAHSRNDKLKAKKKELSCEALHQIKNILMNQAPDTYNEDDVYLLPTGVVIASEESLKAMPASPLNSKIMDEIFHGDAKASSWKKIWTQEIKNYDKVALVTLDKKCIDAALPYYDEIDADVDAIKEKYQISVTPCFDSEKGEIYPTVQPEDIDTLDIVLSCFGGFIEHVDTSNSGTSPTLKDTRLEIIKFLSGDMSKDNFSLLLFDNEGAMKLNAVSQLLYNAGEEKLDKAINRIGLELGTAIYFNMDGAKKIQFSMLLGNRANVSQAEFYSRYRKHIANDRVRREIAERTFFLFEFKKYLNGNSAPAISNFFSDIEKKAALK